LKGFKFLRALIRDFLNIARILLIGRGTASRTISELPSEQGPEQPARIKADGGGKSKNFNTWRRRFPPSHFAT
jgi:hypothetical protein